MSSPPLIQHLIRETRVGPIRLLIIQMQVLIQTTLITILILIENSHPHCSPSHGLHLQQLISIYNRIVVTSRPSIIANHVNHVSYTTNGGTNMSKTHTNYHNPNNVQPRLKCKAALEAAILDLVN